MPLQMDHSVDKTVYRVFTAAVATIGSLALSLGVSMNASAQGRFDDVKIDIKPLSESVSALFGAGGNIGVSHGPDGILIVDDQYAPMAGKIGAALTVLDQQGGKPRYIVNTHYHGDHTGSNAHFGADAGTTILAHENVRIRLENKEDVMPEELPVITYENKVRIHFNGDTIDIMHLPNAHTDGDSAVMFSKANVLHTGDLFFNGRFPYIDLESGGTVQGYMDSAKKLIASIDQNTIIIPGHGDIANKQDYKNFVAMIEQTYAIVSAMKVQGKTENQAVEAGLGDKWTVWSWRFINEERWIKTLYRG